MTFELNFKLNLTRKSKFKGHSIIWCTRGRAWDETIVVIAFPHQTASDSESEDGSDFVVLVAVGVAAILLIVVLLVGVFFPQLIGYGT